MIDTIINKTPNENELQNVIINSDKIYYPKGIIYYAIAKIPSQQGGIEYFHKYTTQSKLIGIINQIVDIEGPIHTDLLFSRITEAWGIRCGQLVQEKIRAALFLEVHNKRLIHKNSFVWNEKNINLVRIPKGSIGKRKVEHIGMDEICQAALICLKSAISLDEEDLIKEVANLYDLRMTYSVTSRIKMAFGYLKKMEKARNQNNRIFCQ